jgi:hypothetical protein
VSVTIAVEQLQAWTHQQVRGWFSTLGSDLTLHLSVVGLADTFTPLDAQLVAGQEPTDALERFIGDALELIAQQGDEAEIGVRAIIRKDQARTLVSRILALRPGYLGSSEALDATVIVLFYLSDAWNNQISLRAVWDWESQGLARANNRIFVALCDATGYGAGLAMEVYGVNEPHEVRWLPITSGAWRKFLVRAQKIRELQTAENYWATAPKILTPEHLHLEQRNQGLDESCDRLMELRAALSAAYLAGTVLGDSQEGLTLRFAGARSRTCYLPATSEPSHAMFATDGVVGLAQWAYSQTSVDKLIIAQECLASEIPAEELVTLELLEQASRIALDAARANLVLYLRQNAKQYFDLRKDALTALRAYADAVQAAIRGMTEYLVNDLYKTIALLLGVFVAGLFKPEASPYIQGVACASYIVYLVFVLAYVMSARWRQYKREVDSFEKTVKALSELGHKDRMSLREDAHQYDVEFSIYFWITIGVYIGLVAAAGGYWLHLR